MKEINNTKPKTINLGIELLRFVLCLWIVIIHCSYIKPGHRKYLSRNFHVPSFFLLSFYFYYPTILKRKIIRIQFRFQRLLYPYILWSLINFLLYNILEKYTSFGISKDYLSLKDFYLQILTGSKYYKIFWFQFNLIFFTLFITIILFIIKSNLLGILNNIGIISLYLHISGINRKYFSSFSSLIQISLGTLIELIPLAVIGCNLSSINILTKIKVFSFSTYFILMFFIYLLFKYDIFINYKGFLYSNILLNIFAAMTLILFFGSLHLDMSTKISVIIKIITKFTGGIYYIHPIFPKYVMFFIKIKKDYFSSLLIYIFCYLVCFCGNKLFQTNKLKYFIN